MSSEERSHINNAIWLCATHATLIDRDEVTYTTEKLHTIKNDHEANCAKEVVSGTTRTKVPGDLVAVGPDVVCVGEISGVESTQWQINLHYFVVGDLGTLIQFIERFDQSPEYDRYVLVNAIGDGRTLRQAPRLSMERSNYTIICQVHPSFPRIRGVDLPTTWALSAAHDIFAENGKIAEVSGLDALPQNVVTNLSHQKGESPIHQDFGTRFTEYYELLRDSPWLDRLLKLEAIRQSAIPYNDFILHQQYTPLQCVERVWDVEILSGLVDNKRLPIRVTFEIKGHGRWVRELAIFVIPNPNIKIWKDLCAPII